MAINFTFLFLNLAKIQIFIPKSAYGGAGSTGLGIIPKKHFFTASLIEVGDNSHPLYQRALYVFFLSHTIQTPSPVIKARRLSPDHWRLCPGIRHGLHGDPKNCPSTKLCSMVSLLKFAQCHRALSQNTSQTIIANALHFRPNHDDTIIGPYFCTSCTYRNHGGKNASGYWDC